MDVCARNTKILTKLIIIGYKQNVITLQGLLLLFNGLHFRSWNQASARSFHNSVLAWMQRSLYTTKSFKTQTAAWCAWRYACEEDVSWSEHASFTEKWACVNSQQLSMLGNKNPFESQHCNDFGFRHFWQQWPLMCKLLGCIEGKGRRRRGHKYEEILLWESTSLYNSACSCLHFCHSSFVHLCTHIFK